MRDDAPRPAATRRSSTRARTSCSGRTAGAPGKWERFVDLLAGDRHSLHLAGGRLSHLAARYLQLQLRHVRRRTVFLGDPLRTDFGAVLDISHGDVLLVFDFRRYESETRTLVHTTSEHGATVVLITDMWLAPIARNTDVVLSVDLEASFLESLTPAFALVESRMPAVRARIGARAAQRVTPVEDMRPRRTSHDSASSRSSRMPPAGSALPWRRTSRALTR